MLKLHHLGSEESQAQPLRPRLLGGLGRVRFLGLGLPECSTRRGVAAVLPVARK